MNWNFAELCFICLFTLVKTWFFATPPQFSFTFYPIELISAMYGIITIPSVGFQWIVDPLYKLILNGGKFENIVLFEKTYFDSLDLF